MLTKSIVGMYYIMRKMCAYIMLYNVCIYYNSVYIVCVYYIVCVLVRTCIIRIVLHADLQKLL